MMPKSRGCNVLMCCLVGNELSSSLDMMYLADRWHYQSCILPAIFLMPGTKPVSRHCKWTFFHLPFHTGLLALI